MDRAVRARLHGEEFYGAAGVPKCFTVPPAGPITYKDLKWVYRVPNGSAESLYRSDWMGAIPRGQGVKFKAGTGVEGKNESAKDCVERRSLIAYIPWDRVEDLVTGETRH